MFLFHFKKKNVPGRDGGPKGNLLFTDQSCFEENHFSAQLDADVLYQSFCMFFSIKMD
jgi:hypothetical protein